MSDGPLIGVIHVAQSDIHLFSYGTLQQDNVQLSSFGRLLSGRPDTMPGFKTEMVEITDPDVIATSGEKFHPIVVPSSDPADLVSGTVFKITAEELAAADAYEVSDYKRIETILASGTRAWFYIKA
jgi:hypothetical protein